LKYGTPEEVNGCAEQVEQYIMSKLTEIGATIPSAMMSQAPSTEKVNSVAKQSDAVMEQSP
jgi:hypothetical protein